MKTINRNERTFVSPTTSGVQRELKGAVQYNLMKIIMESEIYMTPEDWDDLAEAGELLSQIMYRMRDKKAQDDQTMSASFYEMKAYIEAHAGTSEAKDIVARANKASE